MPEIATFREDVQMELEHRGYDEDDVERIMDIAVAYVTDKAIRRFELEKTEESRDEDESPGYY